MNQNGTYRGVERLDEYTAGYVTELTGDTWDSTYENIKDNSFSVEFQPKVKPKYLPEPVKSLSIFTYNAQTKISPDDPRHNPYGVGENPFFHKLD